MASDDNGTPEAIWQYGGLSEQSTGIGRRCGEPSEQRSAQGENKVLALEDDGIPEALWQVWRTFRAKYWNGKRTVPRKFFGKYGEPSEQRNGLGGEQARYWHGTTVPQKLFGKYDLQSKVLEWEEDGIPEALWQIWMTFSAKYWHGKMTVSQKLFSIRRIFRATYWHGKTTIPQKFFGKYGEPSEQRLGLGGEGAKHWHGKTTVPKKLFGNTEDLQGTVLA